MERRIMHVVEAVVWIFYAIAVCYSLEVWGDAYGANAWLREEEN